MGYVSLIIKVFNYVYTKQSDATVAASALDEKIARFLSDLDSDIMKTEIVALSTVVIGNAALTGHRNGAQFLIIAGELRLQLSCNNMRDKSIATENIFRSY